MGIGTPQLINSNANQRESLVILALNQYCLSRIIFWNPIGAHFLKAVKSHEISDDFGRYRTKDDVKERQVMAVRWSLAWLSPPFVLFLRAVSRKANLKGRQK